MSDQHYLEIVDDEDHIIGRAPYAQIHSEGLLHREVHVWFVTSSGEIIFQHRDKNKETFPGLLDATVGGHVEEGDSYETTALKETLEETGLTLTLDQLIFLSKSRSKSFDDLTGKTNNVFRSNFAFRFFGNLNELHIEEANALGFEAWPMEKLLNVPEQDKIRFIPAMLKPRVLEILAEAVRAVKAK